MVVVEIDQSTDVARAVDTAWLRDHLLAATTHINRAVERIGLMLVGDASMTELHAQHSNLNTTTDVLTFPFSDPNEPIDVDIALCVDEAARQSGDLNHQIERELLLYALHGLLHCCGFDDHDKNGWAAMHAEEDRILSLIGVGPTFDPSKDASP